MLVWLEQTDGQHAGGFLSRDAARFMKQRHQPLGQAFGCSATGKRHLKRRFVRHPREGNGTQGFDLLNGPFTIFSMEGDSKGFRQGLKRNVQPRIHVPAEVMSEGSQRRALGVGAPLFMGIRGSSHTNALRGLSLGLPP